MLAHRGLDEFEVFVAVLACCGRLSPDTVGVGVEIHAGRGRWLNQVTHTAADSACPCRMLVELHPI